MGKHNRKRSCHGERGRHRHHDHHYHQHEFIDDGCHRDEHRDEYREDCHDESRHRHHDDCHDDGHKWRDDCHDESRHGCRGEFADEFRPCVKGCQSPFAHAYGRVFTDVKRCVKCGFDGEGPCRCRRAEFERDRVYPTELCNDCPCGFEKKTFCLKDCCNLQWNNEFKYYYCANIGCLRHEPCVTFKKKSICIDGCPTRVGFGRCGECVC
jgi:hypothetical protein